MITSHENDPFYICRHVHTLRMPSDIISKDDLVVTDIGNRRGERHRQKQREDCIETVKQRETERGRGGETETHAEAERRHRDSQTERNREREREGETETQRGGGETDKETVCLVMKHEITRYRQVN